MRCRTFAHSSAQTLCLVALVASTACEEGLGNTTGTETDFGTDTFATSGFDTDGSSGGASSTTVSTTTPTTTTPTSSTTSASTTTTPADTGSETTDTDPTGADTCLGSGTYDALLIDINDLYGHFPYLMLFYAPGEPDETTEEAVEVVVAADGTVTLAVAARDSGSGNGHTGLSGLTGTITDTCEVTVETTAEFESDTGTFGTIDVSITGILGPYDPDVPPILAITLQGGGIPSGPVTFDVQLAAQE